MSLISVLVYLKTKLMYLEEAMLAQSEGPLSLTTDDNKQSS